MIWLAKTVHFQMAGFLLATMAWILCSVSMGLVQWRVWYQHRPLLSYPSVAFMGMWRVCIYQATNSSHDKPCHSYPRHNNLLPLDMRVSQHLLLAASILGLLAKASSVFALRNVHMGNLEKNVTYNPFVISGLLNIAASSCVLAAVLLNYHSISHAKETAFQSSLPVPFKPDTQKMGSALLVATLGAFLFLLSGIIFLFYPVPKDIKVYPEVSK